MNKEQLHSQIQLVLLAGIAATIPFGVMLNHVFIIAALVHSLVSGSFKEAARNLANDRLARLAIVFFVLHLVSILFSANVHEALAIVERRLSLILFPLLLLVAIPQETTRKVLLVFAGANVVALLYCLARAAAAFSASGETTVFYYHTLSAAVGLNAIYLSAYLVFSIHILLGEAARHKSFARIICLAPVAFLVAGCFLLSSKMMLFVLVLGVIARFVFMGDLLSVRAKVAGVAFALVLPLVAVIALPSLKERITTEIGTSMQVVTLDQYRYDTPFTGTSLRLVIWRYCGEILSEERDWLFGTGTGDFQDLLNEKYRQTGIYTGGSRPGDTGYIGYGPHNQYIETVFSMGITGFIVFVMLLVLLWRVALAGQNQLLIQLVLLLTLFCFTESVLSTNKGIIFFLFFIFLLYSPVKQRNPQAG